MDKNRIQNYREFWPFYLKEHSLWATKLWHAWGLVTAWSIGIIGIIFIGPVFILVGFGLGYAAAWYSHFFIEKNKPASFTYPLWSFISEFRMAFLVLSGRLK